MASDTRPTETEIELAAARVAIKCANTQNCSPGDAVVPIMAIDEDEMPRMLSEDVSQQIWDETRSRIKAAVVQYCDYVD